MQRTTGCRTGSNSENVPPAGSGGQKTRRGLRVNLPAWDAPAAGDDSEKSPVSPSKTVRRVVPAATPDYRLVPISLADESEGKPIPVPDQGTVLDRELLDSANNSISRNGHARLTLVNGEWWLENLSPAKTTYVQVEDRVKIKKGDVILLGDRLFRFEAD